MTKIKLLFCVFTIVGLAGCTSQSRPGGGAQKSTAFTIDGPATTTSIKQGEAQTVSLKINRGSEFKEAVQLKADAPKGIEVVLSDSAVKASDKSDVNIKVAVGNSAEPGEHIIQVTGTPDKGAATTLDLKVRVTERADAMKLEFKNQDTVTIKQGETRTVKIMMDPEPKYTMPIKLQAEAPKGVRAEFASDTVKAAGDSSADLRITAEKNASIGEHTIRVTGNGDAASIKPMEFKVRVVIP